jgi:hypothetical protein
MAPVGGGSSFEQIALQRRLALQGTSGPAALVKNAKVFGIACFACLGGLLYGYNQGVFSGVLTMRSFDNREHSRPCKVALLTLLRHGSLGVQLDQERMAYGDLGTRSLGRLPVLWFCRRDSQPQVCNPHQHWYLREWLSFLPDSATS